MENNNIIIKKLEILNQNVINEKKKIDLYLFNDILIDIKILIKYINELNNELYKVRNENINLINKLSLLEIELYKLKIIV